MANPIKGEVDFVVKEQTYTLRYSTNALCELEEASGKGINDVIADLTSGNVKMTLLRLIFWAGLQDRHEDIDVKDAGELITEIGINRVSELLTEAFALAFPVESKKKPNQKAKA